MKLLISEKVELIRIRKPRYNFELALVACSVRKLLDIRTQIRIRKCAKCHLLGTISRQSGQHQSRHGEIDKGLTTGVRALKIAREPTVAVLPLSTVDNSSFSPYRLTTLLALHILPYKKIIR